MSEPTTTAFNSANRFNELRQLLGGKEQGKIVTDSLSKFAQAYADLLQEINEKMKEGNLSINPGRAERLLEKQGITAGFLVRILRKLEKNLLQVHNDVSRIYQKIENSGENETTTLLKWAWEELNPDTTWENQLDPSDFEIVKDSPLTGLHLVCKNDEVWGIYFPDFYGQQLTLTLDFDDRHHKVPITLSNNMATFRHERGHALDYDDWQDNPDTGMLRSFLDKMGQVEIQEELIGSYLQIVNIYREELIYTLGYIVQKEVHADLERHHLPSDYATNIRKGYFDNLIEPGSPDFNHFISRVQQHPMYDGQNLAEVFTDYITPEQWQEVQTPSDLARLLSRAYSTHFGNALGINYDEQSSLLQQQFSKDLQKILDLVTVFLLEMLVFSRKLLILLRTDKIGSTDQDRAKMVALMLRNLKYIDFKKLSILVNKQWAQTQINIGTDIDSIFALAAEQEQLEQMRSN